ncbi:MAG TPA: WD40 repeat domain-containing protein, partial [Chroococcidiopsis sp.]
MLFRLQSPPVRLASLAALSALLAPVAIATRPALAQTVTAIARLGCTPQEQTQTQQMPWCSNLHNRAIRAVRFSPNGQFLASGSIDQTAKIWNLSASLQRNGSPALVRTLAARTEQVLALAFSPDGTVLATGGGGQESGLKLWDWQRGTLLYEFPRYRAIVFAIAFSPDGRYLASGGNDNVIRVWDLSNRTLLSELPEEQQILSLTFSPDGKTLVSTTLGRTVKLWNLEDEEVETALGPYVHPVWSVAFTPDGDRMIYSAKRGGIRDEPTNTVRVWDLEGEPEQTLQAHDGEIKSIALSPNGRFVVSGGLDNTVKLWDLETNLPIAFQAQHDSEIWSVAFSSDNRTFASG